MFTNTAILPPKTIRCILYAHTHIFYMHTIVQNGHKVAFNANKRTSIAHAMPTPTNTNACGKFRTRMPTIHIACTHLEEVNIIKMFKWYTHVRNPHGLWAYVLILLRVRCDMAIWPVAILSDQIDVHTYIFHFCERPLNALAWPELDMFRPHWDFSRLEMICWCT